MYLSFKLPCIHTQTSAMSDFAAITESIKLMFASLEGLSELLCAPVMIIGTGVLSMKLNAAEV